MQGLRKRGANSRREDRPNLFYPFYYDVENNILSVEKFENAVEILPHLSYGTDGNWRCSKDTARERISELTIQKVKGRGEFSFYEMGASLFDENGFINSAVPTEKIFECVYFAETGKNYVPTAEKNLLGVNDDTEYYFFNDSLSWNTLSEIKKRAKNYVIYAESCNLSENELMKYRITFKQIPFDIRKY